MGGAIRKKTLTALALLLVGPLSLVASAGGAGKAFDGNGIAEPGPPAPGAETGAFDLAAAPDGMVVAAIGGLTNGDWFGAARFLGSGRLDSSFGNGGYTARLKLRGGGRGIRIHANSIVPVSGGEALVGGFQEDREGGTAPLIARYDRHGRLDRGFARKGLIAPEPASEGSSPRDPRTGGGVLLDLATSGPRIVGVGGQNDLGGGRPAAMVIAYRGDGRVDTSFGEGGRFLVPERRKDGYTAFGAVKALAGGKLLVAGYLRGRLSVLRLTAAGALDRQFGGGDGMVTVAPAGTEPDCCVATARLVVAGGRILAMGRVGRGGARPIVLARLELDGDFDDSFGERGRVVGLPDRPETRYFDPHALVVQGRRILVAGTHEVVPFKKGQPIEQMTVVGFRSSGDIDHGFGSEGVDSVAPSRESRGLSGIMLPGGRALFGGLIDGPAGTGADRFRPFLKLYGGN